uniref:ethanolamine kinase n=3 Tax=Cercopithecidae TaxID=9527 RepID=A0A2K5X8E4_MACFA
MDFPWPLLYHSHSLAGPPAGASVRRGSEGWGCWEWLCPFGPSAASVLSPEEAHALPAVLMGHGGEGGGQRRLPGAAGPPRAAAVAYFGISVDPDDILPGALRLIQELRPRWKPEQVRTKRFTDGITNKLVACYVEEDMQDCVLVRVYGERTELLVDRENEVRNFQLLRAHGCAPRLYCTFQNGLCYEYMQGVALGPEHIREPRLFRLIALEMAKIHTIHANGSLPKPTLWHKMYNYFTLVKNEINPSLSADVPKVEVLEQELAWLKEHLSQLESPVVFCHNDLLCKNIIYDSIKGHVRFIDYEYAGYNYQAFDIGNHFNEFAGVNEVDYCLYPARETQLQWLRYYLQAQKGMAVTPREVERLYVQVNKFALASHFFWALWALIQNQYSTIHFDFLRYAVIRFNQYFKVKPQVSALEMPK